MILLVLLTLANQLTACAARTTVAAQVPSTTTKSTEPSVIPNTTTYDIVTKTTVTTKSFISPQANVTSETTVASNTSISPSTGITTDTSVTSTPTSSNATTFITGTTVGSNSTISNPKEPSVILNLSSPTIGSNTTTSISTETSVIPNTSSSRTVSNTTSSKPTETSVIPNTTSSTIGSNTNISEEQAPKAINTSSAEYKPPSGDIWDSTFFTCGSKIYANDSISAGILFPPSDANMPNISSATEGEAVFNRTYETFCGKLPAYTSCVKETVKFQETDMDSRLKMYINMDNVDKAFAVYCNNNASITSHIHCTIKAVESYSCPFGGIFGILEFVTNALQIGLPKDQYCAGLKESIRCRVDQQLRNCSTSYAETMETVYTALMGKYCLL